MAHQTEWRNPKSVATTGAFDDSQTKHGTIRCDESDSSMALKCRPKSNSACCLDLTAIS